MRIAFVSQRYGAEVCGGAELLCRQVAERMARHWELEVLTSCARDSDTWANAYPPGPTRVQGIPVRRFPVSHPRDSQRMGELNDRVFSGHASHQEELDWIVAQGPHAPALLEHLRAEVPHYDAVFFFTYLYAPTVFGVPLARGRCVLVPTAHDEPPIYMQLFRDVFHGADYLIFNTPAEQAFTNRLFGTTAIPQSVVGIGVEPARGADPRRFLDDHADELEGRPFMLYAGRIEHWKGCRTLFSHFMRFLEDIPEHPVKLVLIGAKGMDIPEHPDVMHLGFVSEEEKANAFAAATLIVQSSPYESLSLVALEAWAAEKPVLVNGDCEVLRDQCVRSNGGLWYRSYEEFRHELILLLRDDVLRRRLGAAGRRFVERDCAWDVIERQYLDAAARVIAAAADPPGQGAPAPTPLAFATRRMGTP